MKIIKKGILPPPKITDIYIGECSKCHCEIEGSKEECYPSDDGTKWYYPCNTIGCKRDIEMLPKFPTTGI